MCICAPMDMHMSQAPMLTATSKVAEFKATEVHFHPPLAWQQSAGERKSTAQMAFPQAPGRPAILRAKGGGARSLTPQPCKMSFVIGFPNRRLHWEITGGSPQLPAVALPSALQRGGISNWLDVMGCDTLNSGKWGWKDAPWLHSLQMLGSKNSTGCRCQGLDLLRFCLDKTPRPTVVSRDCLGVIPHH